MMDEILVASTGARVELSSVGFEGIDSGGETRVEIPTTADRINFYDSDGTLRARLEGYSGEYDGLKVVGDAFVCEDASGEGIGFDSSNRRSFSRGHSWLRK